MIRTTSTAPTGSSAEGDTDAWRRFDDREAVEDRIAADISGALGESGF
ncbi:hypothetical protein [Pseudonocardia sp. WMMC193]|nr:hypothetical protein [Pseudonocardia sp. WMMC193]MCF7552599.1 hypothetical protein [Pseudonocardia sp. WMMC193]